MLQGMKHVAAQAATAAEVPVYLFSTYHWAYLNRTTLPWLDRMLVVSAILWGNAHRLMRSAVSEFLPGQRVLQAACVYGTFSRLLADQIGPTGHLEVVDVATLQIDNARRKLQDLAHVQVRQADLADAQCLAADANDAVCCFFLLHEVPETVRRRIVDNLLASVRPGGKIVFTDYHQPHRWHPLRPIMALVFRWLEPFATSLFEASIESRSPRAHEFSWHKTTCFGGLYQKVVGIRRP